MKYTGSRDGERIGAAHYTYAYLDLVRRKPGLLAYPVDIFTLCSELGVDCFPAELLPDTAGAVVKKAGKTPKILINAADSLPRQRFTAAHELGHFVRHMHFDASADLEWAELRDNIATLGTDPVETFCNSFAAALLMPANDVRRELATGLDASALSIRFGVSLQAMSYRLKNLGSM